MQATLPRSVQENERSHIYGGMSLPVIQELAEIEEEMTQLEEVANVLADFESLFHKLDRKSQSDVIHRFVRRIDLGVIKQEG